MTTPIPATPMPGAPMPATALPAGAMAAATLSATPMPASPAPAATGDRPTATSAPAPTRRPTAAELALLLFFHAALSGAFAVAYFSGDEDTYALHQFAGYTALVALALRLVAGLFAPAGSPLRIPHPSAAALRDWCADLIARRPDARRRRSPLYAWMGVAMLIAAGAIAASGFAADFVHAAEGLHHALAEAAPTLFFLHLGVVLGLQALKQRPPRRAATPD